MVFDLATEPRRREYAQSPIGRRSRSLSFYRRAIILSYPRRLHSHFRSRKELHSDDHAADIAAAGGHVVESDQGDRGRSQGAAVKDT